MLKYFIYCRKSSEDEDRQLLSIEGQLEELNLVVCAERLVIVDTLTESKSAKERGRDVFNRMIERIEAGEANAILSWKLDRIARNFDDGGKIIGLLQRGVIKEIRTIGKTYLPTDNVLTIALEFGLANQYVRDLSVNIQRGIRQKVRRGVFPGKAPLGYVNDPKLRTIEPNPKTFQKTKRILERFATGEYSMTDIRREMTAYGLLGARSRKPLPLSSIDGFLRNPFYYGVFLYKNELHQGAHVPMISKQTFDDIQQALLAVGRPRYNKKDKGFLFLNFATCGSCGYSITAERHIKRSGLRLSYYRCSRKSKREPCKERNYIRLEKFAEEVKRNMRLLIIPEVWRERFLAKIDTWETEEFDTKQRHIDRLTLELKALKDRFDRVNTAFVEGGLDLVEFKELKNPLMAERVGLEQKLAALEKSKANRLEPLRQWVFEANQAEKRVLEDNWLEMKAFLKKVGSNRLLRAQTLTVSFKKPWNLLAETTLAVRSTVEISDQSSKWWSRGDSNP